MAKKNPPTTALGQDLRETRERLRYSQDGLGAELSVSGALISRWELGSVRPTLDSLARFADLAGGTEEERDDRYSRWLRMAGYRGIRGEDVGTLPATPDYAGSTVEGAMGRAIIDQEPDPERRFQLVARLREWALQMREGAEGSGPARDPRPSPPGSPEAPHAPASRGTQLPTG